MAWILRVSYRGYHRAYDQLLEKLAGRKMHGSDCVCPLSEPGKRRSRVRHPTKTMTRSVFFSFRTERAAERAAYCLNLVPGTMRVRAWRAKA